MSWSSAKSFPEFFRSAPHQVSSCINDMGSPHELLILSTVTSSARSIFASSPTVKASSPTVKASSSTYNSSKAPFSTAEPWQEPSLTGGWPTPGGSLTTVGSRSSAVGSSPAIHFTAQTRYLYIGHVRMACDGQGACEHGMKDDTGLRPPL